MRTRRTAPERADEDVAVAERIIARLKGKTANLQAESAAVSIELAHAERRLAYARQNPDLTAEARQDAAG